MVCELFCYHILQWFCDGNATALFSSASEEDEVTPKAASSRQTSKKSVMGLRRQTSDTGQETDVSQLSEDEPRVSLRVRQLLSCCRFDGEHFMPLSRRLVLASHQQHLGRVRVNPRF